MLQRSRWKSRVVGSMAVLLMTGSLGWAQVRGRTSFGLGRGISKAALLGSDQVRKELGINESQQSKIATIVTESREKSRALLSGLRDLSREKRREKFKELRAKFGKIVEETDSKLSGVLTDAQGRRLNEILLQLRGTAALRDKAVAEKLKLTAKQQKGIKALYDTQRDMLGKLFAGVRDIPREKRREKFRELRKKMEELRTETDKAVLEVLTAAQRKQFAELTGKKIDLDRRSLFRGRFGRRRSGNRRRPSSEKKPQT